MTLRSLDGDYWRDRYSDGSDRWDLGGPSRPLKEYLDQLTDRSMRLLIPGAGRAYEAEYAHQIGFSNVFVIDLTDAPFRDLLARCPSFPKEHLVIGDFFAHEAQYDRIIEQTFFCALDPSLRSRYVEHMPRLLATGGKLVGVLFDDTLNTDQPPFGGHRDDYMPLFRAHFSDVAMEPCYNSIAPRAGRELWLCASGQAAYTPVDCSLYDHYEEAATLKQVVDLSLIDGTAVSDIIVDLFIRDQIEWMRLRSGQEIRLDRIIGLRKEQR